MATTIFILPLGSYKTGTTDVPPTSVPAASTQLTASIDVSQMSDPATSFTASFDVAIDGVSMAAVGRVPPRRRPSPA
jgi:hypothetical protein